MIKGYLRCSTEEQEDSGLGLEAQKAKLGSVDELYTDVCSGASLARPQLDVLLGSLVPGDVLRVTKLCRLSRSVVDFCGLVSRSQAEGWAIQCLDPDLDLSTPNGRFLAKVLAAMVEWEREIIGQRTKEALAAKRARGEHIGGKPHISPDLALRIRSMREHMTYAAIAERLNEEGVPTANGGVEWRPSSLQRVLA